MKTLAEMLSTARNKSGMSLREAADRAGISNPYLCLLENGKCKEPSVFILAKLSRLYKIDFTPLLEAAGYGDELRMIKEEL